MAYGVGGNYGNVIGPTIPGRFVNGPEDISPSEVPANGDLCLFPKSDFSCIYARQWGANGIMGVTFVPERPPQIPQQPQETQQAKSNEPDIAKSLEAINKRLDKMERRINSNNRNRNKRKEKVENE